MCKRFKYVANYFDGESDDKFEKTLRKSLALSYFEDDTL